MAPLCGVFKGTNTGLPVIKGVWSVFLVVLHCVVYLRDIYEIDNEALISECRYTSVLSSISFPLLLSGASPPLWKSRYRNFRGQATTLV
jgi:hypothetical protein